jgi:hypothetical protein
MVYQIYIGIIKGINDRRVKGKNNCACNVAEIYKRWKYLIDESVRNRKIKIEENIKRGSTMT